MSTLKEKAEEILQEKEEKIIPENFSNDLEIFGVQGSIENRIGMGLLINCMDADTQSQPDAISYSGSICTGSGRIMLDADTDIGEMIVPYGMITEPLNITADKIKKDETILGIVGTYEGDTPGYYNDDVVGNLANINLYDSSKDGMWSFSSLRFSTDGYKHQFQEARIEPNANDEYPFDMENVDESILPRIIDFGYVYDSQHEIQPYIVMADFEYRVPSFDPEYRFDIELELNLYKSYRGSQSLVFTSAFTGGIGLSQNFIVAYGDVDNHTPIIGSMPQDDYNAIVDVIIRKPV